MCDLFDRSSTAAWDFEGSEVDGDPIMVAKGFILGTVGKPEES